MSEFIIFFVTQDALDRLEGVLIKLDLMNLDIDYTLSICRSHGLLTSLIRIFNVCLNEYAAPIDEIINICFKESQYMPKIGILFDYLQFSLTRKSFPDGSFLNEEIGASIAKDCILRLFSNQALEILHVGEENQFPLLKLLLNINCSELLVIFEIWLDDFYLDYQDKIHHITLLSPNGILDKNLIITAFLYLGETAENAQEESAINVFVAEMIVKYSLHFKFEIIRKLALALSNSSDNDSFISRQNAVISLFTFYESDFINQDLDSYLEVYAKVKFWKVYEFIGRKMRRFDLVLLGLVNDNTRRDSFRESLISLINDPFLSIEEQKTLKDSIYSNIENIVNLSIGIGFTISKFWPFDHSLVLDLLSPKSKLRYLDDLFSDCEIKKDSINSYLIGLYDTWLILLCEFESFRVKPVLTRGFPFTTLKILNACKSNHVFDGTLFLLEQENQFSEALIYLKNELKENANSLLVSEAIGFYKRNKNQLSSNEIQDFYMCIFNSITPNSNFNLESLLDIMIGDLSCFKILIKLIKSTHQSDQLVKILNSLLSLISHESESTQNVLEILEEESMHDLESLLKIRRKARLYM